VLLKHGGLVFCVQVSAHAKCVVSVTLLNETTTGGHKFRINGMAVTAYQG
jgi:hypothetical protein